MNTSFRIHESLKKKLFKNAILTRIIKFPILPPFRSNHTTQPSKSTLKHSYTNDIITKFSSAHSLSLYLPEQPEQMKV